MLYPLMAKIALMIFGLSPATNPEGCILFLRLFSILPTVILVLLGYTHIRRWFGDMCGLLFSLLLGCSSCTYYYSLQMRMYSWAALFVFCTFLCAYRCLKEDASLGTWLKLALFGVLGAYTHYFALAAVFFLEIALLMVLWKSHPQKRIPWFLCGVLQAVAYLPGLLLLMKQFGGVRQGYWIRVHYPEIFGEIISFFFQGALKPKTAFVLGCLGLVVVLGGVWYRHWKKRKLEGEVLFLTLFPLGAVCGAGLLVSLLQPIFIARYLYPMEGLFFLAMAVSLSFLQGKGRLLCWGLCMLFVATGLRGGWTRYQSLTHFENTNWSIPIQEQGTDGDAFFCSDLNVGCQPAVFYPENPLFYYNEFQWNHKNGLGGFTFEKEISSPADLAKELESGQQVWIFDSSSSHLSQEDLGALVCRMEPVSYFHPYSGQWITISLWYKP